MMRAYVKLRGTSQPNKPENQWEIPNGHLLFSQMNAIGRVCDREKIPDYGSFFSEITDDFEPLSWYPVGEGVDMIKGILSALERRPDCLPRSKSMREAFMFCCETLSSLPPATLFHFVIYN